VFIVAEAGVNHFGSLEKAKHLVDLAVQSGADALKIQVFQTDRLISSQSEEWFERFRRKELTHNEIRKVRNYCQSRGILFFATGHEETSVDFLASLDVPVFKIGSGEVNNWAFLKYIAKKGKPIILSTGMYMLEEVGQALESILQSGNRDVIVLHCVSSYPTPVQEVNLRAMDTLRREFKILVGYSDHTIGYEIPLAAVAMGACVIEKHITLDRNVPNAHDWIVSCGPDDFPLMIQAKIN